VADFLLPSGFMQSVTVLHAEFRTELVVNLYSGWIAQLADASFPGTPIFPPLFIELLTVPFNIIPTGATIEKNSGRCQVKDSG